MRWDEVGKIRSSFSDSELLDSDAEDDSLSLEGEEEERERDRELERDRRDLTSSGKDEAEEAIDGKKLERGGVIVEAKPEMQRKDTS